MLFRSDSNETLTALMDAVMKDEDIPSDCYIRHQAEGIDIICPNIGLAGTEVKLVNAMSREYVLKQILYRASQYDHTSDTYIPKKLSQRMYHLADGTKVQRDWYSSYLLYCINKTYTQINKLKCRSNFATMYQKEKNMIEEIIRSGKKIMNSGDRKSVV